MPAAYVHIEEKFCTGCSKCVRACPTKALRIRGQRAQLFDYLCIGCGECMRVCPEGAITSTVSHQVSAPADKVSVAIVSPILYAQFPGVMPCDVLVALKRIGFDQAIDLSYYLEMYQYATEQFINHNRMHNEVPWPVISPICPVVERLIGLKYPDLMEHIMPLRRPVALVGEQVRKGVSQEYGVAEHDVVLYHLTPCPSKLASGQQSAAAPANDLTCIDLALGINDIYPDLLEAVEAVKDQELNLYPHQHLNFIPNARGPMWGMSGGEIAGMNIERVLAVSGLQETIKYIEKIEMGLFTDMEYIEFRACLEGCLGGPLTAVDKYVARSTVQKLIKMFGLGRRIQRDKLRRLYDRGWFFAEIRPAEKREQYRKKGPALTIEELQRIEHIWARTPGHDCGACGAPDCRTFAEDVVRGDANLTDCYQFALDQYRHGSRNSTQKS